MEELRYQDLKKKDLLDLLIERTRKLEDLQEEKKRLTRELLLRREDLNRVDTAAEAVLMLNDAEAVGVAVIRQFAENAERIAEEEDEQTGRIREESAAREAAMNKAREEEVERIRTETTRRLTAVNKEIKRLMETYPLLTKF